MMAWIAGGCWLVAFMVFLTIVIFKDWIAKKPDMTEGFILYVFFCLCVAGFLFFEYPKWFK